MNSKPNCGWGIDCWWPKYSTVSPSQWKKQPLVLTALNSSEGNDIPSSVSKEQMYCFPLKEKNKMAIVSRCLSNKSNVDSYTLQPEYLAKHFNNVFFSFLAPPLPPTHFIPFSFPGLGFGSFSF